MPRSEQGYLPGTEPVRNKKVHPRAKDYQEKRDAKIAANKEEKEAHDNLLDAMVSEDLEVYEYGNLRVTVNNKQKCSVQDTSRREVDGEP